MVRIGADRTKAQFDNLAGNIEKSWNEIVGYDDSLHESSYFHRSTPPHHLRLPPQLQLPRPHTSIQYNTLGKEILYKTPIHSERKKRISSSFNSIQHFSWAGQFIQLISAGLGGRYNFISLGIGPGVSLQPAAAITAAAIAASLRVKETITYPCHHPLVDHVACEFIRNWKLLVECNSLK